MAVKRRGVPTASELAKLRTRVEKRIRPASKLPKRFRGLFYARSGKGKTRLAASCPDVLIIDVNEEGTDSVRNDFDPNVYRVYYWDEINDIYWYLQSGDHPYKAFAIDGLTGLQELCMKFVLGDEASRDASRDPDMPSRQAYGKVSELMRTQITNFRNLKMHAIFTALERKTFVGEDDDDEDVEITYGPALSPAIAGAAERAVGMIGYLQTRNVVVKSKVTRGGREKTIRTKKAVPRLLIGPSERYLTKDRYHVGVPYIDAPDIGVMLKTIYGGDK